MILPFGLRCSISVAKRIFTGTLNAANRSARKERYVSSPTRFVSDAVEAPVHFILGLVGDGIEEQKVHCLQLG